MKKKVAWILAAIMGISMAAACASKNESSAKNKGYNGKNAVSAHAAAVDEYVSGDDYYYAAETTAAAYSEEAEYVYEDYDGENIDFNW